MPGLHPPREETSFLLTHSFCGMEVVVGAAQAPSPHAVLYQTVRRDSKSICAFSQQTPTCSSAPWQQFWARGNHSAKLCLILCSWTILTHLANKLPSKGSEAEVQTSFHSCTVKKRELSVFSMCNFHSLYRAQFQTYWWAVPQHRKSNAETVFWGKLNT